jgi:putative CocE/NonD family hydrolase
VSRKHNIPVRARDGVALATDLYFPEGVAGPLPVIYMATPYNKDRQSSAAEFFAGQGFAVALQDVRGKFRSQGTFVVEHNHGADGVDTIEWITKQPWSNGQVGMFGCSYHGQVQLSTAKYRPKALRALITIGDAGQGGAPRPDGMNGPRLGGAILLDTVVPWMREYMSKVSANVPGWPDISDEKTGDRFFDLNLKIPATDYSKVYMHLPLKDMIEFANSPPTDWDDYLRPYTDPWWKTFDNPRPTDTFDVPAIHVTTFFDFGVSGTINFWKMFADHSVSDLAQRNQFLILAPGFHCEVETLPEHLLSGERDDGDARLDFYHLYVEWFRHWLTSATPGDFVGVPKVLYYATGENRWRTDTQWPPRGVHASRLYLSSEGDARTALGNGVLEPVAPERERDDSFTYDPAVPTLTAGGNSMSKSAKNGSVDQRDREARRDVLVYTTAPLRKALRIAGPVTLALYVSSTAPDTDFHGTLVEVLPDGRALNVSQGILRARFRNGYDRPEEFMKRDAVYLIRVSLRDASHVFVAGSRIRVDIASASFPEYDRNLNTGGDNISETRWNRADNTVHHSSRYPSYLEVMSDELMEKSAFATQVSGR